ncbi:hypothetical protein N0V92_002104 [Colletotrichum tropicale]|nr:hypothetical protein N0V92_002104 [Colletotrichum tropicale]
MPPPPDPDNAEVALDGGHSSAEEDYKEITRQHVDRTRELCDEEKPVEPAREREKTILEQEYEKARRKKDNSYDLISVIALSNEHLSMTMFGSSLSLERGSPKKRTHIPTLDAWVVLGNMVMTGTPDRTFPGADEAGKMTVPMSKYHDLEVTFHSVDYMKVKVPAGAIRRYRKCLPESEGGLYRDTRQY